MIFRHDGRGEIVAVSPCDDGKITDVFNIRPINHRCSFAIVLGLAFLGAAIDLVTKELAFRALGPPPSPVWWIWPGYFGFETSVNTGALFGLGQGNVAIFAVISVIAMVAIFAWMLWGPGVGELWFALTLGLILAGIVGNLYDRLGLWGTAGVRDWILLQYGNFVWPNFNLADSFLVCGAILMAIRAMLVVEVAPSSSEITSA